VIRDLICPNAYGYPAETGTIRGGREELVVIVVTYFCFRRYL
jgi:hypothetical protein